MRNVTEKPMIPISEDLWQYARLTDRVERLLTRGDYYDTFIAQNMVCDFESVRTGYEPFCKILLERILDIRTKLRTDWRVSVR